MIKEIIMAGLISMIPIGELRAGMPFAVAAGMPLWLTFIVCVIGNALVAPIGFFFLEYVHHHFMHINCYQTLFDKFMERTRKKAKAKIERYGYFGLVLLVAIPLPFTGAYTGTLAAWFFGMNKKRSLLCITLGVIIAGLIVIGLIATGTTAWNWIFKTV